MEFKKPDRQRRQLDVPRRGSSLPTISHLPPSSPAPKRPSTPPPDNATDPVKPLSPNHSAKILFTTRFIRLSARKKMILVSTLGSGLVCLLIVGFLVQQSSPTQTHGGMAGTPEYQTILPTGKSISELGGWKRVSPTQNDPVFAYIDTIDGISVSVSQQQLPKSFESNIDSHIAELAKKFNATTKLTADTITLYVGTSAKGPQSTIFAKNNLLILIKSQKKIDDASWQRYASSLS